MKRLTNILLSVATISILCSCNGYDKLLKSSDYEAKFQAGVKYFNEEHYSRAKQLFENLTQFYRGNEHNEDIAWYYGQSLMKTGNYYVGAYQFKVFTKRYPYSRHAEEAAFLSAYCQYMDSPTYSLDQTITKEAIAEFEQFADRYPQSTHIPEVNAYLDELRGKLMQKDYEIAVGYYNTESYRAAVTTLEAFLNEYPDSQHREDAMYYILKSSYEYAINSREDKMKERLQQVINNFEKFATSFPDSKRIDECRTLYNKSMAALGTL